MAGQGSAPAEPAARPNRNPRTTRAVSAENRRGPEQQTMCGRITQQLSQDQMAEMYGVRASPPPPNQPPRYNGAPGQHFTACRLEPHGARALVRLRWGLAPSWSQDPSSGSRLINARAESVHFKPSFRAAFRRRRCLLPVDGWFEWQQTDRRKQPYFLTLKDGSPLSFAALWERWEKGSGTLETFTIITTLASPGLEDLHHRQPAIIHPRWFSNWLDPRTPLPALLELARQPHDGPFERRAVSTRVNSVRNDDPDILLRLPAPVSEMF